MPGRAEHGSSVGREVGMWMGWGWGDWELGGRGRGLNSGWDASAGIDLDLPRRMDLDADRVCVCLSTYSGIQRLDRACIVYCSVLLAAQTRTSTSSRTRSLSWAGKDPVADARECGGEERRGDEGAGSRRTRLDCRLQTDEGDKAARYPNPEVVLTLEQGAWRKNLGACSHA